MNTLYVLVVVAASVFGSQDIEENCDTDLNLIQTLPEVQDQDENDNLFSKGNETHPGEQEQAPIENRIQKVISKEVYHQKSKGHSELILPILPLVVLVIVMAILIRINRCSNEIVRIF